MTPSLLRHAFLVDPFDLCWESASESLHRTRGDEIPKVGLREFLLRIREVFRTATSAIRHPGTWDGKIAGRMFFLTTTANHRHAVAPILNRLGKDAVQSDDELLEWMNRQAALCSIPFLPVLLLRWLFARRYQRRTVVAYFCEYWVVYGQFVVGSRLMRHGPTLAVFTNDHRPLHRAVARAAQVHGIPTAFVPHAGVIAGFPPLGYDYAFLDGLNMAREYGRCGPSTAAVLLAGVPRLDSVVNRPPRGERRILICPGVQDRFERYDRILRDLSKLWPPENVTVRPHPRDPNVVGFRETARSLGCKFSDARTERAETALERADIVVSGFSNIISEASVSRRRVAVLPPESGGDDAYGYLTAGLAEAVVWSAQEVVEFALGADGARPAGDEELRPWMATLGTQWEGRSAELIAGTMRDIVELGAIPRDRWSLVDDDDAGEIHVPAEDVDAARG